MTSIPASRSAAATTLAPRSCPSSPGLATRTRILRCMHAPKRTEVGWFRSFGRSEGHLDGPGWTIPGDGEVAPERKSRGARCSMHEDHALGAALAVAGERVGIDPWRNAASGGGAIPADHVRAG